MAQVSNSNSKPNRSNRNRIHNREPDYINHPDETTTNNLIPNPSRRLWPQHNHYDRSAEIGMDGAEDGNDESDPDEIMLGGSSSSTRIPTWRQPPESLTPDPLEQHVTSTDIDGDRDGDKSDTPVRRIRKGRKRKVSAIDGGDVIAAGRTGSKPKR